MGLVSLVSLSPAGGPVPGEGQNPGPGSFLGRGQIQERASAGSHQELALSMAGGTSALFPLEQRSNSQVLLLQEN